MTMPREAAAGFARNARDAHLTARDAHLKARDAHLEARGAHLKARDIKATPI